MTEAKNNEPAKDNLRSSRQKKPSDKNDDFLKVLKHQRSRSIQNFKFYDSSKFKQNLSNNTNPRICNASSNVT